MSLISLTIKQGKKMAIFIDKKKFKHFLFVTNHVPEIKNPELIKNCEGIRISLDKLSYLLNLEETKSLFTFTEEEMIFCLQLSVMINPDSLNGFILATKLDGGKEIVINFEGDID